eukprot:GHUV01045772.1.p2 GENE.GHUV01045772.1~~GHUV01045772.1.p2  ORF type:complete len:104 (+),score=17.95 GHUV01045772.1:597-908(+)
MQVGPPQAVDCSTAASTPLRPMTVQTSRQQVTLGPKTVRSACHHSEGLLGIGPGMCNSDSSLLLHRDLPHQHGGTNSSAVGPPSLYSVSNEHCCIARTPGTVL